VSARQSVAFMPSLYYVGSVSYFPRYSGGSFKMGHPIYIRIYYIILHIASRGRINQINQHRQSFCFNSILLSGGRHGSDSAVGSSVTLSGDQTLSSPPSWASSPPASPDSAVAISYIPDQQAVLQRVSFTTSSEVRQVNRSTGQQEVNRNTAVPYTPSISSIGGAVLR